MISQHQIQAYALISIILLSQAVPLAADTSTTASHINIEAKDNAKITINKGTTPERLLR